MTAFLNYLKEIFVESLPEDPFLRSLREKAWVGCSLPDKNHEAFQYLPLREFYTQDYQRAVTIVNEDLVRESIYPECKESCLVFINGHYYPSLSCVPESIVVSSLPVALGSYGQFLKNRFTKHLAEETDPFALLNMALHGTGAFIYVPPKCQVASPIQILHLYTGSSFPRLQLFIGAESQVQIISRTLSEGDSPFWTNALMDIAIEEKASVHHVDIVDLPKENWHFQALRASLKSEARYHSIAYNRGAKSERYDYRVALLGEQASAHLQGLSVLRERNQTHTYVLMQHLSPHCHSMQSFKKVLHDHSQSSFQGQIFVHQKAQKTAAYQINNNLTLGPGAIANSKPNLKIFADDVKASHGSTVGQIDEEALFYLKTRGLTTEEATHLLVRGFCQELIDQIPYESVRNSVVL
jgi:Fe-S cluster assembly protein SufD